MVNVTVAKAYSLVVVLSQQKGITSAQAKRCKLQLTDELSMPSMVESLDVAERMFSLDTLRDMAVDGERAIYFKYSGMFSSLGNAEQKREDKAFRTLVGERGVDWNEVLRLENRHLDHTVAAAAQPVLSKRFQSLASIEEEDVKTARVVTDKVLSRKPSDIEKAATATTARWLVAILHGPGALEPSWKHVYTTEERMATRRDLAVLAFALAAFRYEHHAYPKELRELLPDCIDAIPKDCFNGADLHYEARGDGYLLYSVGPNGKDEGGRNHLEGRNYNSPDDDSATAEEKAADDIAIRTPAKGDG